MVKNDDYNAVLIEELRDQNRRILEAVGPLSGLPDAVRKLQENTKEVKSDVKVIRAVVTEHNQELNNRRTADYSA